MGIISSANSVPQNYRDYFPVLSGNTVCTTPSRVDAEYYDIKGGNTATDSGNTCNTSTPDDMCDSSCPIADIDV